MNHFLGIFSYLLSIKNVNVARFARNGSRRNDKYLILFFRYDECKDKLTPYLKKVGFNPAKDVKFMPCSGLTGSGLMEPVGASAPWYS